MRFQRKGFNIYVSVHLYTVLTYIKKLRFSPPVVYVIELSYFAAENKDSSQSLLVFLMVPRRTLIRRKIMQNYPCRKNLLENNGLFLNARVIFTIPKYSLYEILLYCEFVILLYWTGKVTTLNPNNRWKVKFCPFFQTAGILNFQLHLYHTGRRSKMVILKKTLSCKNTGISLFTTALF